MRKALVAFGGLAALAAGAVFALPALLDTPQLRAQVAAALEKKLGRRVDFQGLKLSLIPPSITLREAAVADTPSFSSAPLARAKEFSLHVALMPLLRKEVIVDSIHVESPEIELVRNAAGEWNYASLGSAGASSGGEPPRIDLLEIRDGRVGITDVSKDQPRTQYDHIDIALRDYGGPSPFRVNASLRMPGAGKQRVELDGKSGGSGVFAGTLKLEEASLASLQRFLSMGAPDEFDGSATGETRFSTKPAAYEVSGKLGIDNVKAQGKALGAPLSLDYQLASADDLLKITRLHAKAGVLAIEASGDVNTKESPAALDLRVNAARASITELARIAAVAGVAFGKGMDVRGDLAANLHVRGNASKPQLDGTLDAYSLVVAAAGWKQPVRLPELRVALTPDSVRARDFAVEAGATRLDASFALQDYAGAAPSLDASAVARGARLEELLRIADAFGVKAVEGISGTGQVALDVRARGPIAKSLDLSGTGSIENASITMAALPKPLVIRRSGVRFGPAMAALEGVSGSLGSSNFQGSLTVRQFTAPRLDLDLRIDQIDVASLGSGQPSATPTATAKQAPAGKRAIDSVTGQGRVEIGKLINGSLVFENVRAQAAIDKARLRLDPLTADVYGGRQSGTIAIDLRPDKPRYQANIRIDRVDANKLLSATTALKGLIHGAVGGSAELDFTLGEGEQIARTMTGKVGIKMGTGRIAGFNLLQQLAAIGRFSDKLPAGDAFTDIVGLGGSMSLRDGAGATEDLTLELLGGAMLSASGTLNLTDQSVKMKSMTVFGKGLTEQVGGTKVGGYLTTALTNERGDLVMPVLISGSASAPKLVPDAETFARMKVATLTRPDVVRDAATGVVDAIRNKRPEGLLDILKGKKK